jgi:aspartokinase
MDLKMYKRPLTSLSVVGAHVRVTPGILAKFANALSEKMVNVYCVSNGEYSVSFFVDSEDFEKARDALEGIVTKTASFGALSIMKDIGMLTVTGPDFMKIRGVLAQVASILNNNKINVLGISTSFDSAIILVEWKDCKKAFEAIQKDFKT